MLTEQTLIISFVLIKVPLWQKSPMQPNINRKRPLASSCLALKLPNYNRKMVLSNPLGSWAPVLEYLKKRPQSLVTSYECSEKAVPGV